MLRLRWWPLAIAALLFANPIAAQAQGVPPQWSAWHASAITSDRGYPVFTVGGRPFFPYGAAFFYERIAPDRWEDALRAYRRMGINTIDLYVIWNWHQPSEDRPPDFDGATDPRRDLLGVLRIVRSLGMKVVLRPGPVIRNEWRNGGYPAWLLERPEYDMPLRDVLEGRYPATATLQNTQADAAANEWLDNSVHLAQTQAWLSAVLRAVAPYANEIVAIALDDDQGAYLDNDTWPAPHWHAYVDWLRLTVQSVTGTRVPLFINTYQMKVPAASPAWAWGDWYLSGSNLLTPHELADLDFSTGLLQTQTDRPLMYAEFQAGWLQSADEAAPRPSDPRNTALALHELLRDGAHGIVNFPVQDTIYPDGWEAPWANWYYAWNAALTYSLQRASRYGPTAAFGDDVRRYGALLARTHPAAQAAIVWPPTLFSSLTLQNRDFRAFAGATIAMQRDCSARRLTCDVVDLAYADSQTLARYRTIVMPIPLPKALAATIVTPLARRIATLRRQHRLAFGLGGVRTTALADAPDSTLLLADDGSYAFLDAVNPSDVVRRIGPVRVALVRRNAVVPAFSLPPRSARLVPIGVAASPAQPPPADDSATPTPFTDASAQVLAGARLRVAYAPEAGARIADLDAGSGNVATSIGLLRDFADPVAPPSSRDYIAAYTHPLPAGTFNRPYACAQAAPSDNARSVTCSYDAPDIPAGGARFERTLSIANDAPELRVEERFQPADAASTARLGSISGFAFDEGDRLIAPHGAAYVGILHGTRLTALRWEPGEVAGVTIRATRGAQLVTLVFAHATARFTIGVYAVNDAAQAEELLRANPR